jgi:hypothetical protein
LKVSKLDDSVVDLLRFKAKIRYQTEGGWWGSQKTRVVKDDGVSENYMGRKVLDQLKCQGAVLSTQDAVRMIVGTANVNAVNGIGKCQRVKLNLRFGLSYVYEAEYTVFNVKGFDVVLGKRWMRIIYRRYQIFHHSNKM